MHPCAVTACRRFVPARRLMCAEHWRMVPADLQRQVQFHWRRVQEGEQINIARYRQCRDAAVAVVENGLG